MAVVRSLITKWGFKIDDKPLADLENGLSNVKASVLAVGAVAVAAAGALFGIAKATANAGDSAAKMSMSLGMSAEALQELHFAASIGGVSANTMNTALLKISRTASDAQRGLSTAKDAFTDVGISVTDANGKLKSADALLVELSDRFAKMPDGTKKTALSMELLGRAGAKMIPMLNTGAKGLAELREEAQKSGFVLSNVAAKQSEEFNDALFRLQSVFTGIRNTIGTKLIPVIRIVVDNFRKWVLLNGEFIKSKIDKFIKGLISFLGMVWKMLKKVASITLKLASVFGGLEKIISVVSKAMLIFAGVAFLVGIGQMTKGIFGLAKAFKFAKIQAALAWAVTMIGPLLIGAAIIALGLIIEDLYTFFFTEGESVTGDLLKIFGNLWDKFKKWASEAFISIWEWFGDLKDGIIERTNELINDMKNAWSDFRDWMGDIFNSIGSFITDMAMNAIGGMAKMILDLITNIKSIPIIGKLLSGVDTSFLENGINAVNTVTSATPQSSPTPGQMTQNVNVSPNIKIEVPPGTSPELVGNAVTDGIDKAISKMLREASTATRPREAF